MLCCYTVSKYAIHWSYGYSTLRIHTIHWRWRVSVGLAPRRCWRFSVFCCRGGLFPEKNWWVVVAVFKQSKPSNKNANETMNNIRSISLNYSLKDLIWSYLFIRSPDVFFGVKKNHAPTPTGPLVGPGPWPCPPCGLSRRRGHETTPLRPVATQRAGHCFYLARRETIGSQRLWSITQEDRERGLVGCFFSNIICFFFWITPKIGGFMIQFDASHIF